MEVIKSNKGGQKLCYEGYSYTKKAKSSVSQRWNCDQRTSKNCRAIATTDLDVTVVKSVTEHSHEPDFFKTQALKVRSDIWNSLEGSRGTTGQIVIDKLAQQPVEVRVAAGTVETIKRTARKRKRVNTPAEPKSASEIPIPLPVEYQKTLIFDNEASDRILIFATESGLRLLDVADTWFLDGTHSSAPTQFQQLFILRVPLGDTYQTAVYALLPSKEQSTYEEFFTRVLDACLERDIRPTPSRLVADYEIAIHNAMRSTLSSTIHVQGCFYHLTQSTWRRIQSEGLQRLYREDGTVRHFCGMLDGLAFLPVDDVQEGMRVLQDTVPDRLEGLVEYFDTTYVNGIYRMVMRDGRMKFRRTAPRFPPSTWNVSDSTLTGRERTNNVCEGWNNGFGKLVGHSNPSIWTAITCIEGDAAMVEADIVRYSRGQQSSRPKRKARQTHQKALLTLCQKYSEGKMTIPEFLHSIGFNIRLH